MGDFHGNACGICLYDFGRNKSGLSHQFAQERHRFHRFGIFLPFCQNCKRKQGFMAESRPVIVTYSPPEINNRIAIFFRILLPSNHNVVVPVV